MCHDQHVRVAGVIAGSLARTAPARQPRYPSGGAPIIAAVTRYELLVFLHVLSAIVWVGGVLVSLVLWETAARAKDHATLGRLIEYDDRLGPVFWSPVVLLVLASGIALVADGVWRISDGWVLLGLALLLGALVIVFAAIIPAGKRLAKVVSASGIESAEAQRALLAVRRYSWIEAIVLVGAVFAMTTKPL